MLKALRVLVSMQNVMNFYDKVNDCPEAMEQKFNQIFILFSNFLLFLLYITVEELTCLATWKDGNAHYIVGTLSHSRATSNEERFRCFVYEKINANSKHGKAIWVTSRNIDCHSF